MRWWKDDDFDSDLFKTVGQLYSYAKNTIKISRFFELYILVWIKNSVLLDDNTFGYNTANSIFTVFDYLHGFNSNSRECHLKSC